MRIRIVALVAVACLSSPALGHVGGDILFDLARTARHAGLAGAGTALVRTDALSGNPAGLAWAAGFEITSTYARLHGAADLGVLSLGAPHLAAAVIFLDAGLIGPGLAYRTAGAVAGAGLRMGAIAAGVRGRALRPVYPVPGLGGALDLGLLWRGPIHVGAVWRNAIARSPVSTESWPPELTVGLALPFRANGFVASLVADVVGIGVAPAFAIGGEFGTEWLLVRAGYGPSGIALGAGVRWGPFDLDWALLLHPVLPIAYQISFSVRL